MFSTLLIAAVAIFPSFTVAAPADFPGATFGLAWNSSSPFGQSSGNLGLVDVPLGKAMILQNSSAPQVLSAFFSGATSQGAFLRQACPDNEAHAVLVPKDGVALGEAYHFVWMNASASIPEGSQQLNLHLGPAPTFDTIMANADGAKGLWAADKASFSGSDSIITWLNKTIEENRDVHINLLKTDSTGITC